MLDDAGRDVDKLPFYVSIPHHFATSFRTLYVVIITSIAHTS